MPESRLKHTFFNLALLCSIAGMIILLQISPAGAQKLPAPASVPVYPGLGHFETTFLPEGERLNESPGGDFVIDAGSGIYLSESGANAWLYLSHDVYWADSRAMGISPNFDQDGTVFVGLDYGNDAFLFSRDRGESWEKPAELFIGPVVDIAVSPGYELDQTVYAATTDSLTGLRRSLDGGVHFSNLPQPSSTSQIAEILLSPFFLQDQQVFARLHDSSLWRSLNGGLNWSPIAYNTGGSYLTDLEVVAIEGELGLVAAGGDGLKVSMDFGKKWTAVVLPGEPTSIERVVAAYLPSRNFTEIWAVERYDPLYGFDNKRIFHTVDWGDSWDVFDLAGEVMDLLFSPNYQANQAFYVLARGYLLTTYNFGADWLLVSQQPSLPDDGFSYSDFDQLALAKSPEVGGTSHLFAYPADVIVGYPYEPSSWFLRSLDGGITWQTMGLPAFGGPVKIVAAASYANTPTIFAGIQNSLYRSDNAGQTWQPISKQAFLFEHLELSPNFAIDQTLYGGDYSNGVYRSTDGGLTWEQSNDLKSYLVGVEYSPTYNQDQTLFVNLVDGIRRSEDGGQTWENIGMGGTVMAVSPDYVHDHTLFAGIQFDTSGKLYRSTTGGDAWEELDGFGPYDFFHTIALSPDFGQDQTLIIGIDCRPLYITHDAGTSWFELAGLPVPCGYRASADAMIVRSGEWIQPVVSTGMQVFTYQWPAIEGLPEQLQFCVHEGRALPAQHVLALKFSDGSSSDWSVFDPPDWLSVTPDSGMLPSQPITVAVDPAQISSSQTGVLRFDIRLSTGYLAPMPVPVKALQCPEQIYLPLSVKP